MSDKLKRVILVPWDYSEESEIALAHAFRLAQMVGDNIMLLHLIPRPRLALGAGAKEKINHRELDAHEKLKGEVERLSKQYEAQREELQKILEEEAYQMRQVHEVTILPYVLSYRNITKNLASLYETMGINLVVAAPTYKLQSGKKLDLLRTLSKVKSGRISTVPFIIAKNAPTHRYYTDLVLPLDFSKNFKESIRWVAYLSSYYHCNVNIIKAAPKNNETKKGIANNTYFTKKILDASSVVYGIKNADKAIEFRVEIEKFVKEIDADLVLVMADKIKQLFPNGQITLDVPVMFINPLSKLNQNFN